MVDNKTQKISIGAIIKDPEMLRLLFLIILRVNRFVNMQLKVYR